MESDKEIHKAMRKYGINTSARMAAFLANSMRETAWWTRLDEGNGDRLSYAPWYGRGFLQLTNPDGHFAEGSNCAKYFKFKGHDLKNISAEQIAVLRENIERNNGDAAESAGVYWAWVRASQYADHLSGNIYTTVRVDARSQLTPGLSMVVYANVSFRKSACAINLPSAIDNATPRLNGLADRYPAYAVAQMVLMDAAEFPDEAGKMSFKPSNFISRRIR